MKTAAPARAESRLTLASAHLADGRWSWPERLFWLLPVLAYFLFPSYLLLISQIMITALFALSLDLILGYAGIVSLGHAAFFGLGAYTAGLLAVHGWHEPLSALLAAGLVAALAGWLLSFLVVRGNDLTRLMLTLGIGMLLYEAANKAGSVTGGVDGLAGMTVAPLLGRFEFDLAGQTGFWYVLAVLLLCFILLRRLVASPFGLSLKGLRENSQRMAALGVDARRRLAAVFTVGAAVAGLAGALLAQTTQFVGLDTLGFSRSAELLLILVLGGAGRLYGALAGAVVFLLAQDRLAGMDPAYWQFWIGLLLVVVVLFARGGILGVLGRLPGALRPVAGDKGRRVGQGSAR